jgi:hypothetical protein
LTDFSCKHCKKVRFIGRGEGQGRVWLQCKACGKFQWVAFDTTARQDKAQLAEAQIS